METTTESDVNAETVAYLRMELAARTQDLIRNIEDLQVARRAHERDIRLIGESLMEEAESRGWCADYDEVVSGLNARLTYSLPVRKRTYRVAATFTVYVDVEATDEDNAKDRAVDMFDEVSESIRGTENVEDHEINRSREWDVEEA